MALHEMAGWPRGFWQRQEFDAFHLVVARDLPATPDTLFLRLLGRGGTYLRAAIELATRPEHDWVRPLLKPVLVALGPEMPQDQLEEKDMQAQWNYKEIYAEWEREMKEEGERAGLKESIEMLCNASQIDLSDDRRTQLESCDITELKQLFVELCSTHRWPDS